MFVLAPCLVALIAAASALPPPVVPPLAADFVDAVTSLDFSAATRLYDDILNHGHMDASAFTLAKGIKHAMMLKSLSVDSRESLERLRDRLPTSVRNIVFAASVCFLNADRFEYMYAPNNDYLFSEDSRNVFMWRLGGQVAGSNWTLEETFTPGDYKIINEYGEYLYAHKDHYYLNRRHVFSYIPSQWTGFSTNVWRFYAVGSETIIQNTWYANGVADREFLYAPSNTYSYDANRGRVFSWDNPWTTPSDRSNQWLVLAC